MSANNPFPIGDTRDTSSSVDCQVVSDVTSFAIHHGSSHLVSLSGASTNEIKFNLAHLIMWRPI